MPLIGPKSLAVTSTPVCPVDKARSLTVMSCWLAIFTAAAAPLAEIPAGASPWP
jgi:hypothetical protein